MALEWSNDKEMLKQTMDMMCYNDDGLKYESTLRLSLFLLMPDRSETIVGILIRNNANIVQLLEGIELAKPDEDFEELRVKMMKKLETLGFA